MSDKYKDPIELALVKIDGKYWALNDDDFDVCANTASACGCCENADVRCLSDKFEYLGAIQIPKVYFENESGPYVA